ncbi:ATP-binding protein [Halalkalibacter kiskunsagensis]|uniref:histidine kinase n=1 Tax=Halalkalibacter kiskunsagensis TaxID=1548599 RepID=A0ABV6KDV5_9BACI
MIAEKLLLNVLIVLMPLMVMSFFVNDRKESQSKVILTTLLAIAAVLCMVFAFEEQGLYWDLRYVLLVLAFLYGGRRAGWIVCGVILLTRTYLGGDHIIIGYVVVVVSSTIFNLYANRYRQVNQKWKRVCFVISLVFLPTFIQLTLLTIYLQLLGDFQYQFGQVIFYIFVLMGTLIVAVGFATLLLEQMLERRRMQEEMERAVKMNAISELAASIAHEVRNPLTVVKGFLQLMQKDEKGKNNDYFSIALCEMNRAEEIISDYLNFAKPHSKNVQVMEVNQVLREIVNILTPYALKENVELKIEGSNKTTVRSDQNQFKQVLINLIKNAIEATPKNGKVNVDLEEDKTVVKITITDTGKGMSNEQLTNIGTLFYSTKDKGTGLGTMVSFRIIAEMGGTLRYESKVNVGTKVTIVLPVDSNILHNE